MKKNIIWVILSFIVLLFILWGIGRLIDRYKESNRNHYDFPSTIEVNNYTEHIKSDTIIMILLNKVYNYDTMQINLYKMRDIFNNSNYDIKMYVVSNYAAHSYNIFINNENMSENDLMEYFSHEVVHIDQMERGDLIIYNNNDDYCYYMGEVIIYSKVPYKERPFEIEAFNKQIENYKELNYYLFKK